MKPKSQYKVSSVAHRSNPFEENKFFYPIYKNTVLPVLFHDKEKQVFSVHRIRTKDALFFNITRRNTKR